MKTLEQKIEELTKKHNKEVEAAKKHEEVSQIIPSLKKAMFHDYELYNRKFSIHLDVENLNQCLQLIDEMIKAGVTLVPMGLERKSCTSFKALELCDSEKTIELAPIKYSIDNFRSEISIFCSINGEWCEIVMRNKFGHSVFHNLFYRSIRYVNEKPFECKLNYSSDFMDYQVKWWSSDVITSNYSIFSKTTTIGLEDLRSELERVAR